MLYKVYSIFEFEYTMLQTSKTRKKYQCDSFQEVGSQLIFRGKRISHRHKKKGLNSSLTPWPPDPYLTRLFSRRVRRCCQNVLKKCFVKCLENGPICFRLWAFTYLDPTQTNWALTDAPSLRWAMGAHWCTLSAMGIGQQAKGEGCHAVASFHNCMWLWFSAIWFC